MTDAELSFPWGDRDLPGGYKVGDRVGIFHSDHEKYLFDNPEGIVVEVTEDEVRVTVEVSATPSYLYLIERAAE